MWLHTSGCSHSFQIDSTWTRAATGISLDSTHFSHRLSDLWDVPSLFSLHRKIHFCPGRAHQKILVVFCQEDLSWPYLADKCMWGSQISPNLSVYYELQNADPIKYLQRILIHISLLTFISGICSVSWLCLLLQLQMHQHKRTCLNSIQVRIILFADLSLQAFQHFIQDNPLFFGKKLEWK